MIVIDPGHTYGLRRYDGNGDYAPLIFMKREGPGYPGNVGHHEGTNLQEVLRALIDRVGYLDRQIPDPDNLRVVDHLRTALATLEVRAARRHGRIPPLFDRTVELMPTCATCGHIGCEGMCRGVKGAEEMTQRYSRAVYESSDDAIPGMVLDAEGEWVHYQDVVELQAQVDWVRDVLAERGYDGPLAPAVCPLRELLASQGPTALKTLQGWIDALRKQSVSPEFADCLTYYADAWRESLRLDVALATHGPTSIPEKVEAELERKPIGFIPKWTYDQLTGVLGEASEWGVNTAVYRHNPDDRHVAIYADWPMVVPDLRGCGEGGFDEEAGSER